MKIPHCISKQIVEEIKYITWLHSQRQLTWTHSSSKYVNKILPSTV